MVMGRRSKGAMALFVWMVALRFCGGLAGRAQDMRVVTEPKIPAVCVKLDAALLAGPDTGTGLRQDFDESRLDTERIQKALDGCGAGRAVELAVHVVPVSPINTLGASTPVRMNAFLSGPLELREGVTLLVDKGVTLFGSADPAVYETPNPERKAGDAITCGTSRPRPAALPVFSMNAAARPRGGCRPLINISVKNAAIMGEGVIDGRGYATLKGHDYSWWQMARKAQPNDDVYFSTRLIVANQADGLVLYGITLHNSPNFHVSVNRTDGFTAWGVHLQTPVDKSLIGTDNDARNTDGIDPGTSTNVTVAHSWIDNGDDNIAVKQGVSHMSVIDNHFYSGHGMSIGSETVLGQSFLLVDGLTEDHTTSGIRIKSNVKRGGPVHDLVYRNVCMRDVPIPIAISPYYTNQTVEPFLDPKYEGEKIPDYKGISLENIFSESAGDVLIAGLNDAHRTEVTLKNVAIDGITAGQIHLAYADIRTALPFGAPFLLRADLPKSVVVKREGGSENGPVQPFAKDVCKGKFVPMR